MSGARKYSTSKLQKSFAIVIVACVAILFFSSFDDIQAKARDTRRMAAVSDISRALDLYYDRYGSYPDVLDKDYGDWDTTFEPGGGKVEFISQLLKEGILNSVPRDPINNKVYFYRYKRFAQGSFGCAKSFIIFQVFNFETKQKTHGVGACPDHNFVDDAPNGFTVQKFE